MNFMPSKVQWRVSPRVARAVSELGGNIRLARQRRHLTMQMVAERAGISRVTLSKIERGDTAVTLGTCAMVLLVLGLEQQLAVVAADDPLGRKLQDLSVDQRVVPPHSRTTKSRQPPT